MFYNNDIMVNKNLFVMNMQNNKIVALILHQFKEHFRSHLNKKKYIEVFIIGISIIFLWIQLLLFNCYFPELIENYFASVNIVKIYSVIIIIYFTIFIMLQIFFTKEIQLRHLYLCYNVKKSTIIKLIIIEKIFNLSNSTTIIFFIPFTIISFFPKYGMVSSLLFLILIILSSISITISILLIDIKSIQLSIPIHVIIILTLMLLLLEDVRFRLLFIIERVIFNILDHKIFLFMVLLIILIFLINSCYNNLYRLMYVDIIRKRKNSKYYIVNKLLIGHQNGK